MGENLDETQEPQQPTLNENNERNEINLEIIDAGDITTVYSSKAKPVLNIKWDLENPLASEAGLASENGISNVSNSLVAGGFRRSEIDNIIGKNTSVFVPNVTTELYGNGTNAANQISTQTPRPLLVRKRLIRIIDIWNRIIFGMNINARDNASMNRFFGANLQTNADVLFRNQISHTVGGTTFNETNSWTWLVNSDPSFTFSQISRFLYACIFEIKEKIKLLNTIVEAAELNLDIEALGINNNTDTFNIQGNFDTTPYTSLLEPVHIIPDITHKIWNWSVEPTNANSKFQLLGAFAKHIPQKYSIMLFEPNFLVLLQELIDIIMDMPEEEHFSEIFNGLYVNPKDVRLIEVLVKELVPVDGTEGVEGATSESKIDFDSVHFTGIESIQNEPTKTSHIQFNDIYNFYLKYKNDFDFINETNAYNIKKKKYRYYEDVRVWDEKTALRNAWDTAKNNYRIALINWENNGSIEEDKPELPQLLIDYPLDEPNPINPESSPGPEITETKYIDTGVIKYSDLEPTMTQGNRLSYNPSTNITKISNPKRIMNINVNYIGNTVRFITKTKTGYNFYMLSGQVSGYLAELSNAHHILKYDHDMNFIERIDNLYIATPLHGHDATIVKKDKVYFFSGDYGRFMSSRIDDNGDLVDMKREEIRDYLVNENVESSKWFYGSTNTKYTWTATVQINNVDYIFRKGRIFYPTFNENGTINRVVAGKDLPSEVSSRLEFMRQAFIYDGKLMLVNNRTISIFDFIQTENELELTFIKDIGPEGKAPQNTTKLDTSNYVITKDRFYAIIGNRWLCSYKFNKDLIDFEDLKIEHDFGGDIDNNFRDNFISVVNNKLVVFVINKLLWEFETSGWDTPNNDHSYISIRETYSGEPKPLPEVANWANTRSELSELRKYDFVDEPFMDIHLPYNDNPQYKFPITKNTEQINTLNTRFKNWIKLQKESYTNLDKLLTVFEYCSDLTSDVRYRSRWDHGKTKRSGATHYDIGNRIDNIISLNISKLSTRLGIEYFKSLDTYNRRVHNKELDPTSPEPKPFFKNKVFSSEVYSGFNNGAGTVERNWRFGWSIVKFPKKFEISPKIDENEATIVNGEKYIPCSWFSSGSSEILFPRQFIDTADEDDEMYIGFYNACTSFGVTAQMEELFRQMYPLLTGTEKMHGTSLVTINTLKPQIHANFFKLTFIGDSTGKYFPDSQEELDVSPYGIDRESITKADIFVNIKADDDYPNKDEKFVESMDDEFDKPFVDSFKNIKIFYKLN